MDLVEKQHTPLYSLWFDHYTTDAVRWYNSVIFSKYLYIGNALWWAILLSIEIKPDSLSNSDDGLYQSIFVANS